MASSESFMEFIAEQAEGAGQISYRRMFGEYCLYCNKKPVAFICNDQFYLKATEKGRAFIGDVVEAPPFPGARLWFLIEDRYEDREWFCALLRITEKELPPPKPKKGKKSGVKKYLIG